jgi:hypothetical protein
MGMDGEAVVRWRSLTEYLCGVEGSSVTLSYEEVAELIGGPVPQPAHDWKPQFWANAKRNAYSRRWTDAGFRTRRAGLAKNQVRFVRNVPLPTELVELDSGRLASPASGSATRHR